MSLTAVAALLISALFPFSFNSAPLENSFLLSPTTLGAAVSNAKDPCTTGYIFHDGLCKPRMMDLTATANQKSYLGDTLTAFRAWRDWKNYQPMVKKVAQLTVGKTSDMEKAEAILNWVHASKNYGCPELVDNPSAPCENSPANNNADFPTIFQSPIGVCLDAAIISTAMLRVAGIPSVPKMVESNHIVTVFYANGLWYVADSTFSIDKREARSVSILNKAEARLRFFEIVTGEIERDMKLNDLYCDTQFCMKTPFRTNRQLMNRGMPTAKITFPAMTIAEYDISTGKQILCELKRKGAMSDSFGSAINMYPDSNKGWELAGVSYFIGDSDPVGYITSMVPVGAALSGAPPPIAYRFECLRGYIWGESSLKPIAYKEVTLRAGEGAVITYKDLEKDPSASSEEFKKTINFVKGSTETLKIYPTTPVTKSMANPLFRK
jgi:hypothetical protein